MCEREYSGNRRQIISHAVLGWEGANQKKKRHSFKNYKVLIASQSWTNLKFVKTEQNRTWQITCFCNNVHVHTWDFTVGLSRENRSILYLTLEFRNEDLWNALQDKKKISIKDHKRSLHIDKNTDEFYCDKKILHTSYLSFIYHQSYC